MFASLEDMLRSLRSGGIPGEGSLVYYSRVGSDARFQPASRLSSGVSLGLQPSALVSSSTNLGNFQRALRFGNREPANPGRDGRERFRYTHDDIVYLSDGVREIDSWRLDGAPASEPSTSHAVLVVDSSGSMRKGDVPGYETRTEAVYECLARDFVQPQLAKNQVGEAVVSVIEMSDDATTVLERVPMSARLVENLRDRKHSRARSHGNYLPALDRALELLKKDASKSGRLLLIFLSDGAPSDHNVMECEHGVQVWQPCPTGRLKNGRPLLRNCMRSSQCRAAVRNRVHAECMSRVKRLGDILGRDKIVVGTVAFGPPDEDFKVLDDMAKQLPRGHFQKLGIASDSLRTAFTSLTSQLTALRTESCGRSLTERDREVIQSDDEGSATRVGQDWNKYVTPKVSKMEYNLELRDLFKVSFSPGAVGMAYGRNPFAKGAERLVYHCSEFDLTGRRVGLRLVCKEARHVEFLGLKFHQKCCKIQNEAAKFALEFNRRLGGGPSEKIHFVDCCIYEINDARHGKSWVLAEAELEGSWKKWNNNAGAILPSRSSAAGVGLGAITEEDEDEDSEGSEAERNDHDDVNDVPQCFSHFTYVHSSRRKLVCDLQGVWNTVDGFTLTDPVIHYASESGSRHHNGATDKGQAGIDDFFNTHKCGAMCRRLQLDTCVPQGKAKECVVCLTQPRQGLLRPCGHNVVCRSCARSLRMQNEPCPLCRTRIDRFEEGHFNDTYPCF